MRNRLRLIPFRAGYHVTQPWLDHEKMATWGDCGGREVFTSSEDFEVSRVLGPDGEPLVYELEPMGFDLRKRT